MNAKGVTLLFKKLGEFQKKQKYEKESHNKQYLYKILVGRRENMADRAVSLCVCLSLYSEAPTYGLHFQENV